MRRRPERPFPDRIANVMHQETPSPRMAPDAIHLDGASQDAALHGDAEAADYPADGKTGGNGRLCIVTRESLPVEDLIRFVAGPDGHVVPDIKRQLPGRGCWVTARRSMVDQAIKRKLFARGLKAQVKAQGGPVYNRLIQGRSGGARSCRALRVSC